MAVGKSFARPKALTNIAAVAAIVAGASAIGAIVGVIPSARSERLDVAVAPAASAGAAGALVQDARPRGDFESRSLTPACAACGVVESVRVIPVAGNASGFGAVAGGVTGAALGSQVGRGNGRTALGVLGAVGGAYAGHAIEKKLRSHSGYRVTVRMDDGSTRTVYASAAPAFAVGEKVRVLNGTLAAARGATGSPG